MVKSQIKGNSGESSETLTSVSGTDLGLPSIKWLLLVTIVVLLGYAYGTTVYRTAIICLTDDDYSHGLLLPFISLGLCYQQRKNLAAEIRSPATLLASIFLIPGILIYLVGESSGLLYPTWFSIFPVITGINLLLFGKRITRLMSFPLWLLLMAKPLPDVLLPRLFSQFQDLAASVSARMMELLGVPVFLSGNVINLPGMQLLVEEACSGMRSVITLITVGLLVVYVLACRFSIASVVMGLSLIVAVLLNVVRVTVTGILAYFIHPRYAEGFIHSFSGMVTFLVGLLIVYYLARILKERFGR